MLSFTQQLLPVPVPRVGRTREFGWGFSARRRRVAAPPLRRRQLDGVDGDEQSPSLAVARGSLGAGDTGFFRSGPCPGAPRTSSGQQPAHVPRVSDVGQHGEQRHVAHETHSLFVFLCSLWDLIFMWKIKHTSRRQDDRTVKKKN